MMAQSSTIKDRAVSSDVAKQNVLAAQIDSPYENPKHERFERIANNDLTPEMLLEMQAGKQRLVLEHRLEKLVALRNLAIDNGDPTGKYDTEITQIQGDLE